MILEPVLRALGAAAENYFLSIPPERVAAMSERVQQLLGYSIHPPFMGHANGRHPLRWVGR